ncbi:MAG: ankyrin repeat domain-containing protein [Candidatus Dependentiae bacterium]|nr:ankyrin repeat domain-containing protein [Candidatus Dependentiae bacterium]
MEVKLRATHKIVARVGVYVRTYISLAFVIVLCLSGSKTQAMKPVSNSAGWKTVAGCSRGVLKSGPAMLRNKAGLRTINTSNNYGDTPLRTAVNNGQKVDDIKPYMREIIEAANAKRAALKEKAAEVEREKAVLEMMLANEWLAAAVRENDEEQIRQALSAGAKVNQADQWGDTLLMFASKKGHAAAVGMLLEAKAEVDKADIIGWTPLCWAASRGYTDVVGMLIEAKAEVNQADSCGTTPLMCALKGGHATIVGILLGAKAAVNPATDTGLTPLMYAIRGDHTNVVKMLIEANAEVNQTNIHGITPLMSASNSGRVDVAAMLIEAGADVSKVGDIKPEMRAVIDAAKEKRDAQQQAAEVERE